MIGVVCRSVHSCDDRRRSRDHQANVACSTGSGKPGRLGCGGRGRRRSEGPSGKARPHNPRSVHAGDERLEAGTGIEGAHAGLAGTFLAFLGIFLGRMLHNPNLDPIASIAIGLLLAAVAI